jgi:HAD domain in Swiss Army Knife RNA repair proteins
VKILFLDFDGVLNSADYVKNRREIRRPSGHAIDALTIPRLNAIVERTGAKVVVSSSWRHQYNAQRLGEILALHGFTGEVIGTTPDHVLPSDEYVRGLAADCVKAGIGYAHERGYEIQAWLTEHPEATRFAIVDDDSDMVHLAHRHVKTSWETGLLDEHVELLVALLSE